MPKIWRSWRHPGFSPLVIGISQTRGKKAWISADVFCSVLCLLWRNVDDQGFERGVRNEISCCLMEHLSASLWPLINHSRQQHDGNCLKYCTSADIPFPIVLGDVQILHLEQNRDIRWWRHVGIYIKSHTFGLPNNIGSPMPRVRTWWIIPQNTLLHQRIFMLSPSPLFARCQ